MTLQMLLSILVRFILYFVHWMVLAFLPILVKDIGLTDIEIGTAIGLFALSSMALMLPMGVFSDYFSPKRTLLAGALFFIFYFFSLPSVDSYALLLPVILAGGFGAAALIVVTESLYLKQFCQEKRGMRVAIYQVSTYAGFGLGPLAGGYLVTQNSALLFHVAFAGALLLFVLILFLEDFEPISFAFKEYGSDILQFRPLLLVFCIFVLGTHFGIEQTSLSLLMKKQLFLSSKEIGIIFAGIGLWMAAIVPIIGWLHDRRKDVFLFFLAGLGFSGLFQIFTAWASGFRELLFIRLLHTMGDAVALLELGVLIALFYPSQRLGGNSGLLYALRALATFLAALLSGFINREWGYGASFLGNGVFVVAFVIIAVIFITVSPDRMKAVGWKR